MSTARRLELLELLQRRPLTTGGELAQRLGVDRRTLRRDVAALQEVGIPVEGERGVGGGYRLRPGFRLPPLMFSEDEAIALVLSLEAARRLGLGDPDGAENALAKVHRVLPDGLRRRAEALEETLAFTTPPTSAEAPSGHTALQLAEAIRRRRRVRIAYRSHSGEVSERELSPHGLVIHAGRWYLAADDHGREELRTFRVDRIGRTTLADEAAVPPPADFDAVAHVTQGLARVPWPWAVEVLLELPIDRARQRVPASLAELGEEDGGTLLRMRTSSLPWTASLLAGLHCAFHVRRPNELRDAVRELGRRLADS